MERVLTRFRGLEKALPVRIVLENGFEAVTPVHHVAEGSWILDVQFATHAANLTPALTIGKG